MFTSRVLRTAAVTLALGAGLATGTATAAQPSATNTPVADSPLGSGSASGSTEPGSILCWLLHPSPTCQL